jgi:hypothetical protein
VADEACDRIESGADLQHHNTVAALLRLMVDGLQKHRGCVASTRLLAVLKIFTFVALSIVITIASPSKWHPASRHTLS